MIGAVPAFLALTFGVTALLYASVGFGGGSTYSALLALSGLDYRLLPLVSLACNIVVVTGGSIRFARSGVTPWRKALVIVSLGAPASFVGGLTPIKEATFLTLLGASLVLTALTMLLPVRDSVNGSATRLARWMPLAAAPLGYLAGLVGIGGGIFLAPLLHLGRWHEARGIAATASLFILVNSLFGLAGQMLKNGPDLFGTAINAALPLLLAVVIGGQVGSLMAARLLPPKWIRWLTALLVLVVGARLLAGV
ncbi:sulfoacetate transporter [Porphyrobacter sp. HT-58-2]|uniref:sulfite exporter TauE/SafE family protein n=1 Tax=Porphyrobacter sp. HT-58-2 TaxID=2023229 RepID=UPI000CDBEE13|nr:sulfite exporter TauE/SafE family protein [Porphyrobacter sp. HT-58-2]AUX70934.1 sulfoacetate transporter [Porphyrobacter sp. HT-58-2]